MSYIRHAHKFQKDAILLFKPRRPVQLVDWAAKPLFDREAFKQRVRVSIERRGRLLIT